MKKIGFVGLGSMGLPMARNLARAGFAVTGFDLRAEAGAQLAAAGGTAAPSLTDAFAGQDAVVLMVVNATQAEDILFGAGALAHLAPGGVVILMATCPPAAVAALASRVEGEGRHVVDAPVSGGVVGAEAGSLTIMVAAQAGLFAQVQPVLDAMGSKVVRLGDRPGQGATAKAVNQLLCGVHLAAAAEALSLAETLGLDMDAMLDIVSGSAASSWMLRDRGPRMLERNPRVTSAVDIFVKDLGIVLEAGTGARTALPLAAIAHQHFLSVSGRGRGAEDDSQVIAAYRALQGRA
ncbi:NAD(P)-dependent oxidoreductase [Aquabacter sp. L1I39]|uniref:NAD(P)-dependent oxidoreductase n=1 Tax=Aquabacter sp. L1I39 TaxID=2820278 RepID=UPI001ADACDBB|nr:NAD(P)-dependent oxidoreductase [Aquabacter sp. L1I39]QTL04738.1 NAD(P)-dependent oxidoreductase [Aquabacter sp. L1I39]